MSINRNAFKYGFIKRCEFLGVKPEDLLEGIEKNAATISEHLSNLVNSGHKQFREAKNPEWTKLQMGTVAAGLGAVPFLGGAAAGVMGSKLKGNYLDEKDIRNQEIIDELKRQTTLAKQNQLMRG